MSTDNYDVVVVGGGVAGCYTAYRLLNGEFKPGSPLLQYLKENGKDKPKVGLFEYSGRVGGRLLSAMIPETPEGSFTEDDLKYAEFGGFRFQPQMHIVSDLANHLKLANQPFPFDEPTDNFVYVRGKRLRRKQLSPEYLRQNPGTLPYSLRLHEQAILEGAPPGDLGSYVANKAFGDILNYVPKTKDPEKTRKILGNVSSPFLYSDLYDAYHQAFREGETTNWPPDAAIKVRVLLDLYETAKKNAIVDGLHLYQWSGATLQSKYLSQEAVNYLNDTGGYGTEFDNNEANSLVDSFFFAPTWHHITEGYSAIPNGLYEGFKECGGESHLSHQLIRFDKKGKHDEGYILQFYKRGQNADCTVTTRFLVLAMPRKGVMSLNQDTFFFKGEIGSKLNMVGDVPALRMFLAYDKPWWTSQGVSKGRSVTDLPVRQFYYWMTRKDKKSVLLATYASGQAEAYWQNLQKEGNDFDSLDGAANPKSRPSANQGQGPRPSKKEMVKLAHKFIMEVQGVTDLKEAPLPYYGHFQNWAHGPWGGGWHAWQVGANSDELIPELLQPLSEEEVYLVGECWSNVQGWVQGALNTSETMLQKKLGLEWPTWLTKGGTWLGPGSDT